MNCTQTSSYSSLKLPDQLVGSANIFWAVLNWCWNKFVVRHWGSPILMWFYKEPWRNDALFKGLFWWDIACVLRKINVQGYETLFFHVMWFHDFQKCWWFDFYLLLIFLRIRFKLFMWFSRMASRVNYVWSLLWIPSASGVLKVNQSICNIEKFSPVQRNLLWKEFPCVTCCVWAMGGPALFLPFFLAHFFFGTLDELRNQRVVRSLLCVFTL